jgi:hypothetical protein
MFPNQSDGIGTIIIKVLFLAFVVVCVLYGIFFTVATITYNVLVNDVRKSVADFQEPTPNGFKFVDCGIPYGPDRPRRVMVLYEPTGMTIEVGTYQQLELALSIPGEHKGNNELSDQQYTTWLKERAKIDLVESSVSEDLTVAGQTMRYFGGSLDGKGVVVGFLPQDLVIARSASKDLDFVVFKRFLDSIRALKAFPPR